MVVLVLDVGGSHVKIRASNSRRLVKVPSGPGMTARQMVAGVRAATAGWKYDVITIGYPGVVTQGKVTANPVNMGTGWAGFDFKRAFHRPVKVINDAAMQAWGSYKGGRMLFLGLGTGLGTAMVVDGVIVPMEMAHLPYRKGRSYEEYLGKHGLKRLGLQKWRQHVHQVIEMLTAALQVDDVVIGGGNVSKTGRLPRGVRQGRNTNAFLGGVRLWRPAGSRAR